VRRGFGGGLVDGLVSIRGHFGRRVPTEIPACGLKMSQCERRSSGGGEWRGGVTSTSSSSSSSPPEDLGSEGVSSLHALAATRATLQACLLCLRVHRRLL
jgi:hypothetical protein